MSRSCSQPTSPDTILLVEDNHDDRILTEKALRRCGIYHRVVVAHDGVEALDYLFSQPKSHLPSLVLLDLKLPRLHGLDVLERIRRNERTRHLRVVVLTSSDEERDMVESRRLGADGYVRKVVDFTAFCHMVNQLRSEWLGSRADEPPGDMA